MKKIVHMTSVHKRYDVRIFLKQCILLAKSGYNVSLIVADGLGDEVNFGVRIFDVGNSGGRLDRMINTTSRIYEKAKLLSADLYHFHDPELMPAGLRLKKNGYKVIFDSHENYSEDLLDKNYINKSIRSLVSYVYRFYEKRSVKKFDYIVTATPSIKQYFNSIGVRALDINNFPFKEEFASSFISTSEKEFDVIYIGLISEIRGVKLIVDAIEEDGFHSLAMAGTFSDHAFENDIKKSKGWTKVRYFGHINRKEIAELLSKSRIGAVNFLPAPNHIESQPNKIFEYMSAGLPVICSNFPLWREIIERNDCGICVDPSSTREIGIAIKYLIDNPDVASRMGANGRKVILSKYNWEAESDKFLKFYSEILDKS